MRCLSLFSGIGGFDLALQRQGHTIIGACEIDKYAQSIYQKHFPGVPIHEDATKINPDDLPDFDIICAGFPCQAFSIAGKRRGFDDTRGSLFFEIARIAKQKQPRYLLLENVKGLLSHDKGETFRTILNTLDEIGYDAEWQVINSKYFVPQNRERVFIIGHLRGSGGRKVFPLGEIGKVDVCSCRETQEETQHTDVEISSALTANYYKGWGSSRTMIVLHQSTSQTLSANGGDFGIIEPNLKVLNCGASQGNRVYDVNGISQTLASCAGGGKTGLYYISQKNSNMKQRYQERDNTWTLTNNGGDFGIKDGSRIRRLTPKECERLQGFPDNYTKYGVNDELISDTQRYKCIGNAVTVPVIQYILKSIH